MLRLTSLIARDLADLKNLVKGPMMIGRLKFRLKILTPKNTCKTTLWDYTKRIRGEETIIKVTFHESYALEQAIFVSASLKANPPLRSDYIEGSAIFTDEAVLDFVQLIDDPNELHRGQNVLVPGLMLLDVLMQEYNPIQELFTRGEIKFLTPLYSNEAYHIVGNEIIKNTSAPVARLTLEEKK